MVGNMVTTWQERMLDCTALPRGVVAPADTLNMAVIDRHYSAGRSFLNLQDVLTHLQVQHIACDVVRSQAVQAAVAARSATLSKHSTAHWLVFLLDLVLTPVVIVRFTDIVDACLSSPDLPDELCLALQFRQALASETWISAVQLL